MAGIHEKIAYFVRLPLRQTLGVFLRAEADSCAWRAVRRMAALAAIAGLRVA
jgi:hypothetical protein